MAIPFVRTVQSYELFMRNYQLVVFIILIASVLTTFNYEELPSLGGLIIKFPVVSWQHASNANLRGK